MQRRAECWRGGGLTRVCVRQVCLLDLDYNLPVQARDSALGVEDEVLPESDAGKEYALAKMQADGTLSADSSFAKARPAEPLLPVCAHVAF